MSTPVATNWDTWTSYIALVIQCEKGRYPICSGNSDKYLHWLWRCQLPCLIIKWELSFQVFELSFRGLGSSSFLGRCFLGWKIWDAARRLWIWSWSYCRYELYTYHIYIYICTSISLIIIIYIYIMYVYYKNTHRKREVYHSVHGLAFGCITSEFQTSHGSRPHPLQLTTGNWHSSDYPCVSCTNVATYIYIYIYIY